MGGVCLSIAIFLLSMTPQTGINVKLRNYLPSLKKFDFLFLVQSEKFNITFLDQLPNPEPSFKQ